MDESYEIDGETFEWDIKKAAANDKKHGVSFHRACQVFFDPFVKVVDASNEHDDRQAAIGYDTEQCLLYVVFIERYDEAIRVISARHATRSEWRDYERQ